MDGKIYSWSVKRGNVIIDQYEHHIVIELHEENNTSCFLTYSDADEIAGILTEVSRKIWEDPSFIKKPYTEKLYKRDEDDFFWESGDAQLHLKYNDTENAVEIMIFGRRKIYLEVNHVVEIVQILDHLNSKN
ncbi:hypothetical protein NZ698_18525 [Chryseobacterium sp. PBS4-4]|uniref:DUF3805 domain-containing protein n=1 Tax=Chryseobacterium edaphi TaxID=2976532 RepID=A0ABT2WAG0_9FLAO|nr:hypothetical protein [Chryseobacterium edaphi]MCU7619179.1 hypothetical protein [Chryseobacterium edaphi]